MATFKRSISRFRTEPPTIPTQRPVKKTAFSTPEIKWVCEKRGPNRSLTDSSQQQSRNATTSFQARPKVSDERIAVSSTLPLTPGDLLYWEVGWKIAVQGSFHPGTRRLLQMGVATKDVLKTATDATPLEKLNEAGTTVIFEVDQDGNKYGLWAARGGVVLDPRIELVHRLGDDWLDLQLGFFFHGPKSTLYITEVSAPGVLWMSKVNTKQPLHPFVCGWDKERQGKEIYLRLKTGSEIDMCEKKKNFLTDLSKGVVSWSKTVNNDGDKDTDTDGKRDDRTPAIKWEIDTLGSGCSLTVDDTLLSNNASGVTIPKPRYPYTFPGTRGTIGLSSGDLVYWEVWWKVLWRGFLKSEVRHLIQMGAATSNALRAAREDSNVETLNKDGLTVVISISPGKDYIASGACRGVQLPPRRLSEVAHHAEYTEGALGFLFDGATSTMCVTKAATSETLWMSRVDVKRRLFPFVWLPRKDTIGKEILVLLRSGLGLDMTKEKRRFLEHFPKVKRPKVASSDPRFPDD